MNKCALLGCELEDDDLSLGDIITKFPDTKASYQAKLLIEHYGFRKSDILCIDCFWK